MFYIKIAFKVDAEKISRAFFSITNETTVNSPTINYIQLAFLN
jgi:hypothetical protein